MPNKPQPRLLHTAGMPEESNAFPDSSLPGFRGRNRFLLGPDAAVIDPGLYVELLTCPPGEALGEHDHPHNEAFFILDGTWTVSWADRHGGTPETVTAEPWDLIWVPGGWWRSATHQGTTDAHLLVITNGGTDCDLPAWLQDLIDTSHQP